MKKETIQIISSVMVITIISIALMAFFLSGRFSKGAVLDFPNVFSGGVTEGSTSCGIASTQIRARNVARQYLAIVNTDASNSVDISLGNTALSQSGIRIGPNRSS